jgi:hypothetical protein
MSGLLKGGISTALPVQRTQSSIDDKSAGFRLQRDVKTARVAVPHR